MKRIYKVVFALLIPIIPLLIFKSSFKNEVEEPQKINLKEKYPYISFPIGCQGATEEEYSKRKANSSGYHEPEIYTVSYQNVWDSQKDSQQFNVLRNINGQWVQKYPKKQGSNQTASINFAHQAAVENYLEEVAVRPNEIDVLGSGYIFTGDGQTITLSSKYQFTPLSAKENVACFDDKKRYLNLYITDFSQTAATEMPNDLAFNILTPQYCKAYSFLETSGDLFIVCLSEKISKNEMGLLMLGYSIDEFESSYDPTVILSRLVPVYKHLYVRNNLDAKKLRPEYGNIVRNKNGEYFVFAGTQILKISLGDDGYLTTGTVDIPATSGTLNLSYPSPYNYKDYNSPYFFMWFEYNSVTQGAIFDVGSGKFLEIDQNSCFKDSPEKFFNDKIDPFVGGPYKSLEYKVKSPSVIEVKQSSQNSGCATYEGNIDIVIDGNSARCEIEIIGDVSC